MARILGIVLPYNPLLLAWFPCCMYSTTLQSSSLRLGNLKGKPKIWFAFVENMFFLSRIVTLLAHSVVSIHTHRQFS